MSGGRKSVRIAFSDSSWWLCFFSIATFNIKKNYDIYVYNSNSEVIFNEIKKYQDFELQMLQRSRD